MTVRAYFRQHRSVILFTVVVFVVALVPRLIGVGQFLTADEKNWVLRSVEFLKAMREFRINDTLQTTHPGITTLWVAGVATAVATRVLGTPFQFGDLQRFVLAAQIPIAVINAVLVAAIYLAARLVLPTRLALLAALAVALEPLLVAHSKIVHVDAFLTGFLVLAALLFMAAEERRTAITLIASAVAGALAIISKIPGVFIIPFALLVLYSRRDAWASRTEWLTRLRFFGQWAFFVAIAVLLLWPSLLWVPNPLGNVNLVRRDITTAAVTPHHMAEDYTINPWFYPATLLTRTSLPVFAGVSALIALLLTRRGRQSIESIVGKRFVLLALAFVVLFVVFMILGAKKGDRYILPVFPFLNILSVVGLLAVARQVLPQRLSHLVVAVIVLGIAGFRLFRLGPYALAYFSPLFPPNLGSELGWGEGLDQVARYLDGVPGTATVASWYPEELRALTGKPVLHLNAHEQIRIGYVVLYRNMFGRAPDHPANDFIDEYYRKREPVFVAEVNGLPYAWVYRKPVFATALGRMTADRIIVAELPVAADSLSRIDVLTATYAGRATFGTFTLRLRESLAGPDLRVVQRPVTELKNNEYTSFSFPPVPDSAGKTFVVILQARGTRPDNAPTVRAATDENGKHFAILTPSTLTKEAFEHGRRGGIVGLRWYAFVDGRELSQDEISRQQ